MDAGRRRRGVSVCRCGDQRFVTSGDDLFGRGRGAEGPIEGLLAGVGLGGAVVLVLAAQTRQRAQTREGKRIFLTTVVIWVVWAEVVQEFSFRSDWMFHGLPQVVRGGHLLVSALIAVVPLLIGALMLGRRR